MNADAQSFCQEYTVLFDRDAESSDDEMDVDGDSSVGSDDESHDASKTNLKESTAEDQSAAPDPANEPRKLKKSDILDFSQIRWSEPT